MQHRRRIIWWYSRFFSLVIPPLCGYFFLSAHSALKSCAESAGYPERLQDRLILSRFCGEKIFILFGTSVQMPPHFIGRAGCLRILFFLALVKYRNCWESRFTPVSCYLLTSGMYRSS